MAMPTDRRRVAIAAPAGIDGIGGMAATDGHRAGIVVWNKSGAAQVVSVALRDIPFPHGTFRAYRIDADHASWGDNPANEALTATETRDGVDTAALAWSGPLPRDAVVYLEVDDGSGLSEALAHPVATVVRILRLSWLPKVSVRQIYYCHRTDTLGSHDNTLAWIGARTLTFRVVLSVSVAHAL